MQNSRDAGVKALRQLSTLWEQNTLDSNVREYIRGDNNNNDANHTAKILQEGLETS